MSSQDPPGDDTDDGPISRRNLIRLLVGLGLGIPIAVEARTVLGILDQQFLGGETHDGTANASPDTVAVGDELLPKTTPVERLTMMVVEARDSDWTFHLEADVENTGDRPYEFRLGTVYTTNGVGTGGTTTGSLDPGETTTLTAEWSVPEGGKPNAVDAIGITNPDGDAARVSARVHLGNVPVDRQL